MGMSFIDSRKENKHSKILKNWKLLQTLSQSSDVSIRLLWEDRLYICMLGACDEITYKRKNKLKQKKIRTWSKEKEE